MPLRRKGGGGRARLGAFAALLVLTAPPAGAQVLGAPLPGPALPLPLPSGPAAERPLPERPPRVRAPRPDAVAPGPPLPDPGAAAGSLLGSLEAATADLRRLRLEALAAAHPGAFERDRAGALVVRGRVLAISPTDEALAAARRAGFEVVEQSRLAALGLTLVALRPPAGVSAAEGLARLQSLDPAGQYELDHVYTPAGETAAAAPAGSDGGRGRAGPLVGLVDSGVDARHPALLRLRIEQRGFAPGGVQAQAHGTAVASLIAGRGAGFAGAAPGARLLVADVYGTSPAGGSAAIIARALAWLAEARAPVINISLVGPPNRVLEASVGSLAARGHLLVAAVGNDGPAAPPLYPAAYPGVVGVTAVDARRRALPEAGRGPHVAFAAPGTDMAGAHAGGGFVALRGTSFAAPLVAGELARRLPAPDPAAAARALAALEREAADLGAPGRDPVYGSGLVAAARRVPPEAVAARSGLLTGR